MSAVLDLFADAVDQTVEQQHVVADPVAAAIFAIESVLLSDKALALAYSSGKDSSTVANLAFTAALNVKRRTGHCPPIHVLNADTGVESPVVRALADQELARMRSFGTAKDLPISTHVSHPTLSASWAVRIIGGRALPSFPQNGSDCTVDYKIAPMNRLRKWLRQQDGCEGIVTLIGTRSAESAHRALATAQRKETAHTTWCGPEGDERLSPILHWSTDMVWEYLGECAAGAHPSYSPMTELMEFYSDAGASSCVVVADMRSTGNSKPCGARGGCWSCVRVSSDHSVENMLAEAPDKYPYLLPLLRLRNFIADTAWDYSLRNFIGRTIDPEGYMPVKADQYNPEMLEALLRYTLSAQEEAMELGAPASVRPIGEREIIALDFWWSLRAIAPPYTALRIYFEWQDRRGGEYWRPPEVTKPVRPAPCPDVGRIRVGTCWDSDAHPLRPTGLRHDILEMHGEACGTQLRTGSKGQVFLDLLEEPEFDVDLEGACLFIDFEGRRKVADYRNWRGDWTAAASDYLGVFQCIRLAKGQSSKVDSMMRRSQWLQRHRLHGQQGVAELRKRCDSLSHTQADLI